MRGLKIFLSIGYLFIVAYACVKAFSLVEATMCIAFLVFATLVLNAIDRIEKGE